VRVKHVVEAAGNHVIRFCCALWVFNCTGLPIALQQVMLCLLPTVLLDWRSDTAQVAGTCSQVRYARAVSTWLQCHRTDRM